MTQQLNDSMTRRPFLKLFAISLIALAIICCSGGRMEPTSKTTLPSINNVPAEAWQKLSQKKIYFGHQSVGYNIVDGIRDIMKENPQIVLNIVETSNPSDFSAPIFGHSAIGENTNPKSKSDAFTNIIVAGLGEKVDIALFKFCYVDFGLNTDAAKTFDQYRNTLRKLRREYPKVTFIHITAPLTTPPTGIADRVKRFIKLTIGRPIANIEDNMRREEFNTLVRKEFGGKDPIFDLAAMESTHPNGRNETFDRNGKTYPSLVPQYTGDGGHLNKMGRKIVAEQFLIFLSKL
jgi:hypothetical protein